MADPRRKIAAYLRWARRFGSPVDTRGAAKLWEFCSAYHSPLSPESASRLYAACGYVPFAGFPLVRARRG